MGDRVQWKGAPPLWQDDGLAGSIALDQPALLRFATDDFIERLQRQLADDVGGVGDFVARPETWRAPAAGLGAPAGDLTLYQPIHGRFYLVTGGLVCLRYGLPDKVVHAGCGESVCFVLRRLEPVGDAAVDPRRPGTYRELGWVAEGNGRWEAVASGLVAGEEHLALFAMSYVEPSPNGAGAPGPPARRRLLAGLLPVSARERYEAAVVAPPLPADAVDDPAYALGEPGVDRVDAAVVALQSVLTLAATPSVQGGDDATLDLFRESFFFALVDLATLLADLVPNVWDGTPASDAEERLADRLANTFTPFPAPRTWSEALHRAHEHRDAVLAQLVEPPPPVTDLDVTAITTAVGVLGVSIGDPSDPTDTVVDPSDTVLFGLLHDALAAPAAANGTTTPDGAPATEATFRQGAVYVVRLVYERPQCPPSERLVISEPSDAFRFAHFYDPDAPFRETRIVLPVDTSLEGLRKFPRTVRLEVSNQLRRQMDRIQAIKLGDLDDGNIPGERPLDLGMVCSLSIPIITISALVLLMIIVSLLNIVFFWMPLFKICKPKVG